MNDLHNKVEIGVQPEMPYAIEEALNRLRINVSFLGGDIRKIMVVSSEPNEGKSFIAMNLWRQLASAGEKSILVDADLRKSVMVETYDIHSEDGIKLYGLSDFLAGTRNLDRCIYSTDLPYGDILPNISNIINPSLMLESSRFAEMLDTLGKAYRYVILDVPPLGIVSDGEFIGNLCDGAILDIRCGVTPRQVVRSSRQQLERANCPLLGVVLNRASGSKNGYYHKYYGRYYGSYYGDGAYASKDAKKAGSHRSHHSEESSKRR